MSLPGRSGSVRRSSSATEPRSSGWGAVAIDSRNEDFPGAGARAPRARAWTSFSTGSAAGCRFRSFRALRPGGSARHLRPLLLDLGRAQELARMDRAGQGDRGRLALGPGSRPAGGCAPTASRSCAKDTRRFPGEFAIRFPWGEAPGEPEQFREDFRVCSSYCARGRSTRSWPSACRSLRRAARTNCSRARRRRGRSCSCHEPTRRQPNLPVLDPQVLRELRLVAGSPRLASSSRLRA